MSIPRLPTCPLPKELFDQVFAALDIIGKVDRRTLSTESLRVDPSNAIPSGSSHLLRHRRRSDGTAVAVTHVLYDRRGRVRHRHGKEVLVGSIRFTRPGE